MEEKFRRASLVGTAVGLIFNKPSILPLNLYGLMPLEQHSVDFEFDEPLNELDIPQTDYW